MTTQAATAIAFRALHEGPELLRLPNAWDAGSARVIEAQGAKAIATTSAAVAWSRGYPDGDALPVEALVATVEQIVRAVSVPVTVDVEGGYSDDPVKAGETIAAVLAAGAVGINIEDGSGSPDRLRAKIREARRAAERAGVALFVNARIDVFLRGLAPDPASALEESLRRARLYVDAGADGVFVPLALELETIAAIAAGVGRPLNVLARPGLPPATALRGAGVRRLSAGAAIGQAALGLTARLAAGFLASGDVAPLFEGETPYPNPNGLFTT